jgi:hypothetical protein
MASITAANAIFILLIPGVFPVPVQLQGFSADDIFDFDVNITVETLMGVDGKLSGGFVNVAKKQSITLQADSASNNIFDLWQQAQYTALNTIIAQGTVWLTSIGTKWALINGFLTDYPPVPGAGKILKPRKYGLTWESITPAPV